MLLDLVEQRERLMRAHAVFSRIHAHITARGDLGELGHDTPGDPTPFDAEDPWEYCEDYKTDVRGWVLLFWQIEPAGTDAPGNVSYRVEVVLAVEDLEAETDEVEEGATLGIVWTEKDGWAAEHYDCEGELQIEEIVRETPNGPLATEAEALACINRLVDYYMKVRRATPDLPDAKA